MTKTLVIGSNGYIGSRLFPELKDAVGVDLNWFGNPNSNVIREDYKNLTEEFLSKFTNVILLAGHSSVKMCDGPIQDVWYNNVNNFLGLVKKLSKDQLLIYASSGSVYGAMNEEQTQFVPVNNYDLTKYTLDLHAAKLIEQGHKIVGLRFGTVNGYSPNFRSDLMINAMFSNAVKNNKIVLSNLTAQRPILAIRDLVGAVKSIIENPVPGIYDVCSFSSTVEEIGLLVSDKMNISVDIEKNCSSTYDFSFTNKLFETTFDFKFQENIKSIVEEIDSNFHRQTETQRNLFKAYK